MSAVIVDDPGNNAAVDSESEVRKLQDLVKKLQTQNQILLKGSDKQPGYADVENTPYVVDANCNTDVFQCASSSRSGVLREQQLNLNNARVPGRSSTEMDNDGGEAMHVYDGSADKHDNPLMSTSQENLSLDTVQLVDVEGMLTDDEESWLYKTPEKSASSAQSLVLQSSPHDWLRTDFDRPSPSVSSARRSLVIKLDQVARPSPIDIPKVGVHKFDVKKALADIQAVDRGDITDIISVRPSSRTLGRLTTASGPVNARQLDSELRSSSPRASVARRASAADGSWYASPSSPARDVRTASSLSKSSEQIDGISALEHSSASSAVTAAMPGDELGIGSKLDGSVKWTSASEENLLATGARLHDVTDIKQLARLQEESLRLSYNAPLVMSKKGLSKSLNRSSGALVLDESESPDMSSHGLTNTLNRSSGSLQQSGDGPATSMDTSPTRLTGSSRHTSRSAGNLLSSGLSTASHTSGRQMPAAVGNSRYTGSSVANSQSPAYATSTLPRSGAGGLRTPRSALRTSKQPTGKAEPRSTSLHAPRSGYSAARTGVGQRNGLSVARPEPSNSLPSSPHSSDPDSLDGPEAAVRAMSHTGHRQSLPNLTRSTKLSVSSAVAGSGERSAAAALRASAQQTAMNSSKLLSQLKQPTRGSARHPPSPARNYRSTAVNAREQSPLSAVSSSSAKTNGMAQQSSRIATLNRSRIPSPGSRRNLVSAAAASSDDSWKDGCF